MKFVKILICTILMVAILSVPSFATNEGTYGHYVSAGDYVFDLVLTDGIRNHISFNFLFTSGGISYTGIDLDFVGTNISTGNMVYFENTVVYTNDSGWKDDSYRYISVPTGFYIYDSLVYSWWIKNVTRVGSGYDSSFFDAVMSSFTFVGQWISGAAEDLTAIFWFDNSLTFVGVLSVASLALAVSFLIIAFISRFIRFRG